MAVNMGEPQSVYRWHARRQLLEYARERGTVLGAAHPEKWSTAELAQRLDAWDDEHDVQWQSFEPWRTTLTRLGRKSFDGSTIYDEGIRIMENELRHNPGDKGLEEDLRLTYKYYHPPSPPPLPALRPFHTLKGTGYRDRTLGGGVPTSCIGAVKLSKLSVDTNSSVTLTTKPWTLGGARLLYNGTAPSSCTRVGRGAYGEVYKVSYPSVGSIVLKDQVRTAETVANLRVAASLKACNLVQFRFFQIDGPDVNKNPQRLWTAMEMMTDDCSHLSGPQRADLAGEFGRFVIATLDCLLKNGGTFTDMKLQNCAYAYCAGPPGTAAFRAEFRLIDLDGINGTVATFPISDKLTLNIGDDDKIMATQYAFAVTAALFVLNDRHVDQMFYFTRLASKAKRRKVLETALSVVPPEIAALITKHALPFLQA